MRGSPVDKLERAVASERTQISVDEEEISRLEHAIGDASAEQERVVEREVTGELSADQARKSYEKLAAAISSGRSEQERLRRGLALRQARVAGLEGDLERARFESAVADLEAAYADRAAVSGHLGKNLRVAAATAEKLRLARTRVEQAWAAAKELCPDDAVLDWPANADEPSWGSLDDLTECIATGPLQPIAEELDNAAKLEEHQRSRDSEQIRAALNSGPSMIAKLPEPLRVEAESRWEALAAAARKERDERLVAAGYPPVDDLPDED